MASLDKKANILLIFLTILITIWMMKAYLIENKQKI